MGDIDKILTYETSGFLANVEIDLLKEDTCVEIFKERIKDLISKEVEKQAEEIRRKPSICSGCKTKLFTIDKVVEVK